MLAKIICNTDMYYATFEVLLHGRRSTKIRAWASIDEHQLASQLDQQKALHINKIKSSPDLIRKGCYMLRIKFQKVTCQEVKIDQ
jgi:hypothetical protein